MIRLLVNPRHIRIWLEFALFRLLRITRHRELVIEYKEEYGNKITSSCVFRLFVTMAVYRG